MLTSCCVVPAELLCSLAQDATSALAASISPSAQIFAAKSLAELAIAVSQAHVPSSTMAHVASQHESIKDRATAQTTSNMTRATTTGGATSHLSAGADSPNVGTDSPVDGLDTNTGYNLVASGDRLGSSNVGVLSTASAPNPAADVEGSPHPHVADSMIETDGLAASRTRTQAASEVETSAANSSRSAGRPAEWRRGDHPQTRGPPDATAFLRYVLMPMVLALPLQANARSSRRQ